MASDPAVRHLPVSRHRDRAPEGFTLAARSGGRRASLVRAESFPEEWKRIGTVENRARWGCPAPLCFLEWRQNNSAGIAPGLSFFLDRPAVRYGVAAACRRVNLCVHSPAGTIMLGRPDARPIERQAVRSPYAGDRSTVTLLHSKDMSRCTESP